MSLSTVIMAHPNRARYVASLAARITPKPVVVWDERNDVWDTGRRSLLTADRDKTHALIIQDDAVIPRRLPQTVSQILAHVPPDVPVCLYMGRHRYRPRHFAMSTVAESARQQGASFAVFGGPYWGPGIVLPTSDIEAIVAYGDASSEHNYDLKIARFYASKGVDCWYTMPSIVNHREGRSLVGRGGRKRHAEWYDPDPTQYDWSGGIVTPKVPALP